MLTLAAIKIVVRPTVCANQLIMSLHLNNGAFYEPSHHKQLARHHSPGTDLARWANAAIGGCSRWPAAKDRSATSIGNKGSGTWA